MRIAFHFVTGQCQVQGEVVTKLPKAVAVKTPPNWEADEISPATDSCRVGNSSGLWCVWTASEACVWQVGDALVELVSPDIVSGATTGPEISGGSTSSSPHKFSAQALRKKLPAKHYLAWPHDATVLETTTAGEVWCHIGRHGSLLRHMEAEGFLCTCLHWWIGNRGKGALDPSKPNLCGKMDLKKDLSVPNCGRFSCFE